MQTLITSLTDDDRASERSGSAELQAVKRPAVTNARPVPDSKLRRTLLSEIDCMARFHVSNGSIIDPESLSVLSALDEGRGIDLADMIRLHQSLAALSDIKPHTIRMILEAENGGAVAGVLGPTPAVRRLTLATILFSLAFFATSLSGHVNVETMHSSIYELSGAKLAIKLLLVTSAAGLGAGFAVLFDVWRDLKQYRFDPMSESANWMQLGLGVIAGLILSEIVASEPALSGAGAASMDDRMMMSGPLLALVGGFSATILHLVLKNLVDAFKRVLDPGDTDKPPELVRRTAATTAMPLSGKDVQPPATARPTLPEKPQ